MPSDWRHAAEYGYFVVSVSRVIRGAGNRREAPSSPVRKEKETGF